MIEELRDVGIEEITFERIVGALVCFFPLGYFIYSFLLVQWYNFTINVICSACFKIRSVGEFAPM